MTINGGSTWAAPLQSYNSNIIQSKNSENGSAKTDFNSIMQQLGNILAATLDTNSDGEIDKTEFSQAAQALTQKINSAYDINNTTDKNSDKYTSVDELLSALRVSKNQHSYGKYHKIDATAEQSLQETAASEETSSLEKMKTALLQRVTSAYTNSSIYSNSTTLATA